MTNSTETQSKSIFAPIGFHFDPESRECRPREEVNCDLATLPTTTESSTTVDSSPTGMCRMARNTTFVRNVMAWFVTFFLFLRKIHSVTIVF